MIRLFLILWLILTVPVLAHEFQSRFMSLKNKHVTVRSGPGKQYPIAWIYEHEHLPVHVVDQFDQWLKITDYSQQNGWVHKSALSDKRRALVYLGVKDVSVGGVHTIIPMYKNENSESVRAYVEQFVVVDLATCSTQRCKIIANGYKGWINKKDLWGLSKNEQF